MIVIVVMPSSVSGVIGLRPKVYDARMTAMTGVTVVCDVRVFR
jgi:hypothetical protein